MTKFNVPPVPLLSRKVSPMFEALDLQNNAEQKKNARMRSASISARAINPSANAKLINSSEVRRRELTVVSASQFFEAVNLMEQNETSIINPEEEKKKKKMEREYTKNLLKGVTEKMAKKGKLTNVEIKWLIERAKDSNESHHQLAASRSLVAASFPVETVIGTRALILRSGLLDIIQNFVSQGLLTVHHEISPSEVERISFLAEGAAAKVYK